MAVKIQFRRDTAANWSSTNPVLAIGELGLDLTNGTYKIGNGTDNWNTLTVGSHTASNSATTTTSFDGFLSATEDTVQKALDVLDDHDHYSDITANFTGTLQNGGSNVLVDSDIGVNVQSYDADTTKNDINNVFSVAQRGDRTTLTYSANITADFATSNRFEVTLTGNTTMENPSNIVANQGGMIFIEQDTTGGHDVTWGTYWKFPSSISENTTGSKVNIYSYEVYSTTQIILSYIGAI